MAQTAHHPVDPWWTAGIAGAVSVALGAVHCRSIAAAAHPPQGVDALAASLFGLSIAQFVMAVAGVLVITGECSGGTMHPSLAATPRRTRLLTAKIPVVGVAAEDQHPSGDQRVPAHPGR